MKLPHSVPYFTSELYFGRLFISLMICQIAFYFAASQSCEQVVCGRRETQEGYIENWWPLAALRRVLQYVIYSNFSLHSSFPSTMMMMILLLFLYSEFFSSTNRKSLAIFFSFARRVGTTISERK